MRIKFQMQRSFLMTSNRPLALMSKMKYQLMTKSKKRLHFFTKLERGFLNNNTPNEIKNELLVKTENRKENESGGANHA